MREIYIEDTSVVLLDSKSIKLAFVLNIFAYACLVVMFGWIIFFIGFGKIGDFNANNTVLLIIDILFWVLPVVIFFLGFYFLKKFSNKLSAEYDYSFLSGSVRIATVLRSGVRRGVMKFDVSDIDRIGKVDSTSFANYSKMPVIKKIRLTSNSVPSEGHEFFYMLVRHDGTKKLLTFDCSKTFIMTISRFCNRSVLDKDFV